MLRNTTTAVAWISLAFVTYATLSPLNERPELASLDLFTHLDHYIAYAVVGGVFALAYPRHTFIVCIIVFGSAVLLELAQMLTPDRHARISDAVRKLIGGAIGIAFGRLVIVFWIRDHLISGNRQP
jgi:VanZ family protein